MYQDYSGNYDTSSRGSSTSPAQPESFTSGSSTIGSPISTSSYQKYRVDMPGSNSAFIPTINAITTSQDLQWMVQPTVITSMSNPYSRSHPYGHHLTNGPGLLGHNTLADPESYAPSATPEADASETSSSLQRRRRRGG
ncbi:hypothetical protein OJAV_G00210320 [Oryzias javanicus]|uniref:Fos-related antigen 2 n=1 Tax=Oryzias javanicus TaxID=123683 RepID=A0A437C262_ORYJA|nr:hypothetical protein OJAV_G00210320 [Oryzias javanicus]